MQIAPENVFIAVEPQNDDVTLFVTRGHSRTPTPATPEEIEAIHRQCPHVERLQRVVWWRHGEPTEASPGARRVATATAARVTGAAASAAKPKKSKDEVSK